MKSIGASVGAVLTQEKKPVAAVAEEEIEEEDRHLMRNEMLFCLKEAPEYQISAVGEWCENSRGDIVSEADTYFLHVLTGARCESVWLCLTGWSEPDEKSSEKWETLCERIENLDGMEEYICNEKRVGL